MLKSFNCHNLIKYPTRVTENSATCIDHIYTNNKTSVQNKYIIIEPITDHFPVLTILKYKTKIKKLEPIYYRNFKKLDCNKLLIDTRTKIQNLSNNFYKNPTRSIHEEFQLLTDALQQIINDNVPKVKLSKKKTKMLQKPWLTKEIIKLSKIKNMLFKRLVKNNFKDQELHNKYKQLRNKVTHMIHSSKQKHYQKLLLNSTNDTKKTWNVINDLIGKTKTPAQLPEKLNTMDGIIQDPTKIANALNQHFANIGKSENKQIDYKYIDQNIKKRQKNSIVINYTTSQEIELIIKNLKNKNSEGIDEIPISIIKKMNPEISKILAYLINRSIQYSQYPNCFKVGKVIALYKAGQTTEPGNYRPITLLPALNKIFEMLLFNRLTDFFNKHKTLNDNQYGFRTNHSTELAITKLYEDLLNKTNKDGPVVAIMVDLSKAFDSVNRDILLHKLYRYGIRGPAHQLIKSYLTNRSQYIHSSTTKSHTCSTDVGVPQGSILSPLFFLIEINDLKNCTKLEVINYADDTLLYQSIPQHINAENWINEEFNKVTHWMYKNHLKPNYNKTNYLTFTNKPEYNNLNLYGNKINKTNKIQKVDSCNYLGMIIDNKLNWKLQIDKIKKKISKTVGILYRIRYYLNKTSLKLIYNSLILSYVRYGILNYGRASKVALQPISILMNRGLRCINFIGRRTKRISQIYFDEKILTLQDTFQLELGKFCYKFKKDLLPNSFNQIFTNIPQIHSYNTRNSNNRFFRPKHTGRGYKTLQNLGSKLWNKIPLEIKNSSTIFIFTQKYKQHLLQNY